MPNTMIFNRVASQLQATVEATDFDIRQLTSSDVVTVDTVTNTVTVTATAFDIRALSGATDSVIVSATALDIRPLAQATDTISVGNTVTVTATAFDIRALSGATDSVIVSATALDIRPLAQATDTVSVGNTVTVTATAFDIRALSGATDSVIVSATALDIRPLSAATDSVAMVATNLDIRDLSGATDSVKISSYLFTEDTTSLDGVSDAAAILTKDTSEQGVYSYYISNTGTNPIDVKLQISPTTTDTYFVDDISGTVNVAAGTKAVLVAQQYLKYTRLYYDTSSATCTFEVYYNSRV